MILFILSPTQVITVGSKAYLTFIETFYRNYEYFGTHLHHKHQPLLFLFPWNFKTQNAPKSNH